MSHPEALLADYVDGTLDDRGRADVDAHLLGCARCRDEVELARASRAALAGLEDRPVPFGVTAPVLAEAGRRSERRGVVYERFRWAAGLAAAAALVVVVALNAGDGGEQDAARTAPGTEGTGATGAAAEEAPAPWALPFRGLERQTDVDYEEDGIRSVAEETATQLAAAELTFRSAETLAGAADAEDDATQRARRCVRQSGLQAPQDVLVRLIEAGFDGTPAYIAVFAEGPGAGQPADHVIVLVVAADDCRLLSSASQRIPPR